MSNLKSLGSVMDDVTTSIRQLSKAQAEGAKSLASLEVRLNLLRKRVTSLSAAMSGAAPEEAEKLVVVESS